MSRFASRYRAGDWVEVRSRDEILATLDAQGTLDRLPFMPEMLAFCGRRYRVFASAHKTCDTVRYTGGRRMSDAVHLEGLRCDGASHDGCQANCLLFWKEAWIKPAAAPAATDGIPVSGPRPGAAGLDLQALTRHAGAAAGEVVFVCQATQLREATSALPAWAPRQYLADVTSGNVPFGEAAKVLILSWLHNLRRLPFAYRLTKWIYERAHAALRGTPPPYGSGTIPRGTPTPQQQLGLQVGEVVRVRPHADILATLDGRSRNRGLYFDKEMVRFCGQELRVAARVTRFIDESNGRMLETPTASVALEGAFCTGQYSENRLLCPRRIMPYWREIWLERVEAPQPPAATAPCGSGRAPVSSSAA